MKKRSFFALAIFRQPPCRTPPLLSALSPGRRHTRRELPCFSDCVGPLKGTTCPCNLVTLCSPDQWVVRCSFMFLLFWAENSCKMVGFIYKCWMLSGSVHVPTSQAPFLLWHFCAVYSKASLPNSTLCCDLLPLSFLSCWSACPE